MGSATAAYVSEGASVNASEHTTGLRTLRQPNNSVITYVFGVDTELTNPSTGVYRVDRLVTKSGKHWYRFQGTGAVAAAEEGSFHAKKSKFA